MIRSFKVRLYPTKEQEELMWKHVNCSRFIWNYMLALQDKCGKPTPLGVGWIAQKYKK